MNWKDLVGKKVKNVEMGYVTTVQSFASKPSVQLENGVGFSIGSPMADNFQVIEEKKTLSSHVEHGTMTPGNVEVHSYPEQRVKQTLENIKAKFRKASLINERLFEIIDEEVGGRLV